MTIRKLFDTCSQKTQNHKKPYIIAEAGVNPEGKMDLSKQMIDEARGGGGGAIKF